MGKKLAWVFQLLIVLAVLAGIYGVPTWWSARSALAEAEGQIATLVESSEYQGMIEALNRVMGLVEQADDRRSLAQFGPAGAALTSAQRELDSSSFAPCGDSAFDSDSASAILQLLCTNLRLAGRLVELHLELIGAEVQIEDEAPRAQWSQIADSIRQNADSVGVLMRAVPGSGGE